MKRKSFYMIILVFILFNFISAVDAMTQSTDKQRSELSLDIYPNRCSFTPGELVYIYINITNREDEAKAKNINININLSESIFWPKEDLRIDNMDSNEFNDEIDQQNGFALESKFDGNKDHNDFAFINKNSNLLNIYIGKLDPKRTVSIKFTTSANRSMIKCDNQSICSKITRKNFYWDYEKEENWNEPETPEIHICPKEINKFYIEIIPKNNILGFEGPILILANNSEICIRPVLGNPDNMSGDQKFIYLDDLMDDELPAMPIKNRSVISVIGNHTFSMQSNSSDIVYKNATIFRVIDVETYHLNTSPIAHLLFAFIISFILIIISQHLIIRIEKNYVLCGLTAFVMISFLIFLYIYDSSDSFIGLGFLEAFTFSSVFIMIYLIISLNNKLIEFNFEDRENTSNFFVLGVFLLIFSYFIHYALPKIASDQNIFNLVSIILILIFLIVYDGKETRESNSVSERSLAAMIAAGLIYLFIQPKNGLLLPFVSKFALNELMKLALLFASPLIIISLAFLDIAVFKKIYEIIKEKSQFK